MHRMTKMVRHNDNYICQHELQYIISTKNKIKWNVSVQSTWRSVQQFLAFILYKVAIFNRMCAVSVH